MRVPGRGEISPRCRCHRAPSRALLVAVLGEHRTLTLPQIEALAIVAGMLALFVSDRLRYDIVAALALSAAIVTGVVPAPVPSRASPTRCSSSSPRCWC